MPYYPGYQFNPYQQQAYQPQMPQGNNYQGGNNSMNAMIQPTPAPIQAGFIRVQSEEEARRYPVAPGGSITFIDDNSPHCYVKTAGMSQLDAPVFKKFRLVEEAEQTPANSPENGDINTVSEKNIDLSEYIKKPEFDALRAKYDDVSTIVEKLTREIDKIHFDIDAVSEKSSKKMVQRARKDADED